jgi:hypothetical protein
MSLSISVCAAGRGGAAVAGSGARSGHEELVAALAAPGLRVVLEREAPAGLDGDVDGAAGVAAPAAAAARGRRRPRPHQPPARRLAAPVLLLGRRRARPCREAREDTRMSVA